MAKAGAPPKFKEAHVNWVFWKIAARQPMGRKMLVQETGLGEGSLRTILIKLDEYGLVKSAKPGRTLTENGSKVISRLKQIVRVEQAGRMVMTDKPYNCLVIVKGGGKSVKSGMEQRDAAIKAGRSGATTLVVEKGKLVMPGFERGVNIDKQYPQDAARIKELADPEEGDAIVVGSEDKPQKAEEAAWIAASTLLS
jgi:predicted transcriptional regulator